jgi:hypothetical protein
MCLNNWGQIPIVFNNWNLTPITLVDLLQAIEPEQDDAESLQMSLFEEISGH